MVGDRAGAQGGGGGGGGPSLPFRIRSSTDFHWISFKLSAAICVGCMAQVK